MPAPRGQLPSVPPASPGPRLLRGLPNEHHESLLQEIGGRLPALPRELSLHIPPGRTATTAKLLLLRQVGAGHSRGQKQFACETQCPGKAQGGQPGDPARRAEGLSSLPRKGEGCRAVCPREPPSPALQSPCPESHYSKQGVLGGPQGSPCLVPRG